MRWFFSTPRLVRVLVGAGLVLFLPAIDLHAPPAATPGAALADDDDDDDDDGDDDGGDDDRGDDDRGDDDRGDDDRGDDDWGGGGREDDDDRAGGDDGRDNDATRNLDALGDDLAEEIGAAFGAVRDALERWTGQADADPPAVGPPVPTIAPRVRPIESGEARAGEILVDSTADAVLDELRRLGFTVREQRDLLGLGLGFTRLGVPPGTDTPTALGLARRARPDRAFQPNFVFRPGASPCRADACYARRLIRFASLGDGCPAPERVGLVDTLVADRHPALADRQIVQGSFVSGRPAAPDHGTALAALLVGNGAGGHHGLLAGSRLFAAGVFERGVGGESVAVSSALLQGLDWLAIREVDLVNLSLAGGDDPLLERAVARLALRGVTLVAATGNNGAGAPPAFPAAYPDVLAVTAVDASRRPYRLANRGDYVGFAAPGVDVWVARAPSGGAADSGTSFAAAYVTALAGLAQGSGRARTPKEIEALLRQGAIDLGTQGRDPVFGYGLVTAAGIC